MGRGTRINLIGLCAAGILAIVFPLLGLRSYYMHMAIVIQIYILLGLGLNLTTGYAGQLSLGHAAFYAIGAYTSALLSTRLGWTFWLCAPAAAIAAGVAGMALGVPTLRLKGPYLVISTLGFGEIIRLTLLNWVSLTNGPNGVRNVPPPPPLRLPGGWIIEFTGKTSYYYLLLTVVVAVLFFYHQIVYSRTGRALMSIREDQIAAEISGINLAFHKVFAFTLGAAMAGLAGSMYVHYVGFVSPETFNTAESIHILVTVVVGGMGTIIGPVIGAATVTYVLETLRGLAQYRLTFYGAILFAFAILAPKGIVGLLQGPYGRLARAASSRAVRPGEGI